MTATANRRHITTSGDQAIPASGGGGLKADEVCKRGWLMGRDSSGRLVVATTATGLVSAGLAGVDADATGKDDGEVTIPLLEQVVDLAMGTSSDAFDDGDIGAIAYASDNQTMNATDGGGTRSPLGIFWGLNPDTGQGRFLVGRMAAAMVAADDPLPTLAGTGGAALVGIEDTAGLFTATEVEAALAELAVAPGQVNLPLLSAIDIATGALLAVFADAEGTTPGTQFTNSKTACVRWNDHATPGAIAVNIAVPQDLDDGSNVIFHALVSKTGATIGDATKLTVGAFEIVPGALHDADTDFGGDTNAVVGNATAKTVTELTLTLALADIHTPPEAICFTIKPKAGTLGTDDLLLHAAWIEYPRKKAV